MVDILIILYLYYFILLDFILSCIAVNTYVLFHFVGLKLIKLQQKQTKNVVHCNATNNFVSEMAATPHPIYLHPSCVFLSEHACCVQFSLLARPWSSPPGWPSLRPGLATGTSEVPSPVCRERFWSPGRNKKDLFDEKNAVINNRVRQYYCGTLVTLALRRLA